MNSKEQQQQILQGLLAMGARSRYGRENGFEAISSYAEYRERLPITFYDDIKEQVEAMKRGTPDLLWPGRVDRYAVSAGTTGQGKHLPLTPQRLKSDRRFIRTLTKTYLNSWSRIRSVCGKHLNLPGTVSEEDGIRIGEISGFTARQIPWWLHPFQLRNPVKLSRLPFEQKFELLLEAALGANLRVISAVPSWSLTLFQEALRRTGKEQVSEIWPDLNVMICGGVKLANYRPALEDLYGATDIDFIETYGASEGYFAFSDRFDRHDMKLIYDNQVFYEFVPDPLPGMESLSIQGAVPLWEVEPDRPYALVVTTNAGLWRYALNDIVTFTATDPPRLQVIGRLNEMLDDYGEAVYLYEAEKVLQSVTGRLELNTCAFSVGALMKTGYEAPRHHWFIQCLDPLHPQTLERIADQIDRELCQINRHYAIRRESGALSEPEAHGITQQDINAWMDFRGKDRAQGKFPKLLREREDIEFFL